MSIAEVPERTRAEVDAPVAQRIRDALDAVGLDELLALDRFAHADRATVDVAIDEFARFAAEVLAPTDVDGDRIGNHLDPTGRVVTPPSFPPAYHRYVDAGVNVVPVPLDRGGGGLPRTVGVALQELFAAANVGLSLCPALTQSAIEVFSRWGTDEQRGRYLPRLVTGEWSGTMWITEPDAGSDVGAIRTVARRRDDGRFELTGTKIFISWGDHDMTDNIVHLVLARTPGSAPGTRGLSLFVVPARLVDPTGEPGRPNVVRVVSLEHKLGLHSSPTCVMELDGALGELVGDEGGGMRAMFSMMNPARLSIGLQGLGIGQTALREARAHAAERTQGRAVGAAEGTASTIDRHPDVRRMLSTMSALVDGMRLLVYWTARQADLAAAHPDPIEREQAQDMVDLLTPIAKSWVTDTGVEVASLGIQVHGGMGYVEESRAPQRWRDARIGPIYEGTNGIQAIDLVTRKINRRDGTLVAGMLDEIRRTAEESADPLRGLLLDAVEATGAATSWLLARLDHSPEDALSGATAYLAVLGDLVAGWLLSRWAIDRSTSSASDADHRLAVANFFAVERLASVPGRTVAVTSGASRLLV